MRTTLAEKSPPTRRSARIEPMGRPLKPKTHREVVLSVRVDERLVKELDAVAVSITPGAPQSRTQIVRRALREWLDAHKRDQ